MAGPSRLSVPRWLSWLLAVVALGILAAIVVAAAYPQEILTVEDGEIKADAMVVLGGGTDERPLRAATLYKEGAAPVIFISGFGDGVMNSQILMNAGIPLRDIHFEPKSISTLENARLTIPLLRQLGAHRVIIVTSWYHSRRAMACFRRTAPDIRFYSRPAYGTYPPAQWSKHGTSPYIRLEYLKLLGYWICHGIPPW